jgi:hypothetical protein
LWYFWRAAAAAAAIPVKLSLQRKERRRKKKRNHVALHAQKAKNDWTIESVIPSPPSLSSSPDFVG